MSTHAGNSAAAITDADRIRVQLQLLSLSQRDAARRLGIDDRTMRYYCSGKLPVPSAITLSLRQLEQVLRNEQGLALLADGTITTSDGPVAAERLRESNRKLLSAIDVLVGPLRAEPSAADTELDSGSGDDVPPKHSSVMHFHANHILLLSYRARNRALKECADRTAVGEAATLLTPDANVAIVLAAAATEAFINELAENIGLYRQNAADWQSMTPTVLAAADAIFEIENSHGQVTDKYFRASTCLGKPFNRGGNPFQDFRHLIGLRNSIMHVTPVRPSEEHSGSELTDQLAARGIAMRASPTFNLPWFDRLETPEVARWACDSGRKMILGMLDLIEIPTDRLDPFTMMRTQYRDHKGYGSETWL